MKTGTSAEIQQHSGKNWGNFLGQCACHEEEGRWHFRAQGPFAGVGIAVDLRGVNQTWEGPKPMFADKLLKIHFALDSFDVYKIDTLLHRSKLKKNSFS